MKQKEPIRVPLGLRAGQPTGFALIDVEDAELARLRWYRLASGYAVRVARVDGHRRMIYLHRAVMRLSQGDRGLVDHRNGDRLDNRRANLRVITPSGNSQNRGANAGRDLPRNVYTRGDKWRVQVKPDGRSMHLGVFESVEAADEFARAWRARHMPFSPDAATARAVLTAHHGVGL